MTMAPVVKNSTARRFLHQTAAGVSAVGCGAPTCDHDGAAHAAFGGVSLHLRTNHCLQSGPLLKPKRLGSLSDVRSGR
jgi:hypothetical protein